MQSNEIRKHIFCKVCIYFYLLPPNDQFPWSAEQKTYLKYLRIINNLHFTAASLIMFCYINYQSIWNLITYKFSLYITVSNCCIHYVVIRPAIVNCGNLLYIVWILTAKLYVLFNFSTPPKEICSKLSQQGSFFVTIKKRGNNPILTSKLYVLFHFLTPSKEICSKHSEQGSFFVTIKKRGNNPILTSKLHVLFHFLTPSKEICSKHSEQGSFLWQSKRGVLTLY